MNWNMTKEEIIKAGLIGLCYGSEEISAYTDAEHAKLIPFLNHWFDGGLFNLDFNNIWLIQYDASGIETCNLINY